MEYHRQQMQQLDQIIKESQVILANAPEGTLRISRSNHSTQYYWKNSETNNYGKYIRRSEEGLASALEWKEEKLQYHQPMPYKIETGITTEMGELVRSKSEKIIADKLAMMGIPYIYETPLYLDSYGTIYPDFTVLNKRTKQEFFWEHFGMMDSPEYSEKAIKKIETYERNGFYQGKNLITTFETKYHIPDMNVLEKKIKAFLM